MIFLLIGGFMYKKIYRCKLCRKIIKEEMEGKSFESINIEMLNNDSFNKNGVHLCKNGDMGMLEFLGCRKYSQ